MRSFILATVFLTLIARPSLAQGARPDESADVTVARPAYAASMGPRIGIDSHHHNYHTIGNRFAPFAALAMNDGFRVADSNMAFSAVSLSDIDILVISNALSERSAANWSLPPTSAFAAAEIEALKNWVIEGGALLLIADHAPFGGSAAELADAFGFEFENVVVSHNRPSARGDIFTIADGALREDILTSGRDAEDAVNAVRTFTGSAFRAPSDARPIIVLPNGYALRDCGLPCPDTARSRNAAGWLQGAALVLGQGRLAVFGEAAMFSAQIIPRNPPFRAGFNAAGAEQNKQFVLNVLRWLGGALPE
jgi:hypothetical protein